MREDRFKLSAEFMKAYDCTLKKAVNSLYYESDFRCQSIYPVRISLACKECPFRRSSNFCTDPNFENGAGYKRTFEQWQDWFYNLTGEKDGRPKEMFMKKNEQTKELTEHAEQEIQTEETQINEDNTEKVSYQTKELKAKAKAKYEVEYLDLDSDEPKTRYVQKVVDLLYLIKEWNNEAIKWNLIANGDTSKIPPNFKDIYIKVYINDCDLIFQDKCTLKSKGLKLTWTRAKTIEETINSFSAN